MTVTEKKELLKYLKRGDKKLICKMAGVHETVMYSWITNRLKTSSIEPFIIEVSSRRKKEFELQTNTAPEEELVDDYQLAIENIQLKEDLRYSYRQLNTFQKLVSGRNRIYNQLFLKLKKLIRQSDLSNFHKSVILDTIDQFESDFSFIGRYKMYAEILSSINPLFAKSLETLKVDLSEQEKQILSLIKLNLTNHEIGIILAVSDKKIEAEKELLRYKLKLKPDSDLSDFLISL